MCSSVADVGETSTLEYGAAVWGEYVCVGGGENTKRDGENDSEVQPEDDEAVLGELGWWTLNEEEETC